MRIRPIAVAVLLALAPATTTAPSFAQPSSDDTATKAARARFQEGVTDYDRGQYEQARAAFLQAYALHKHPVVLLNLGQSCVKSGHPLEGVHYLEQFLREASGITSEQRTKAEAGLAEGRGKLARIEISAPTGAEVTVDSDHVGTAPLSEPVDVEAGAHTVKIRLPDGSSDSKQIGVSVGERGSVRFGARSAAPPAAAAPTATAPTAPTAADTPPTTPENTPLEPPTKSSEPGLFSPPDSMAPVYVGIGLGVAGLAGGIVFAIFKGTAQSNADAVSADIRAHGGGSGICNSSRVHDQTLFGPSCNALRDDNSKIDTDALAANISIGVGIAGAALAVGWYLLGPKAAKHESGSIAGPRRSAATSSWPTLTPTVTGSGQGLELRGTF